EAEPALMPRRYTMKPYRSILDEAFHYVPSVATSVADTWRRFGWRPETRKDREKRGRQAGNDLVRRYDTRAFCRLPDAEQRRALLDYLATLK
ncbi:MAG TPA: hypothetical protein VGO08_01580, partial [Burkholderiales bacterium]|nr:hypothetical protein [Burkholderiales bacterium]